MPEDNPRRTEFWIEAALAEVRGSGQEKSVRLLEAVRSEIEFEAKDDEISRQVRRSASCDRNGVCGERLRVVGGFSSRNPLSRP